MGDLLRSLLLAGLLCGLSPFTLTGMLLVMTGDKPRRNGVSFALGACAVETIILVATVALAGATVDPTSTTGQSFTIIRVALGVLLVAVGIRSVRHPREVPTELPKGFEKLNRLSATKCFIAGILLTNYPGAFLAALAIVAAKATEAQAFTSLLIFTVFATGIPLTVALSVSGSERAHQKIEDTTTWLVLHRQRVGQWLCFIFGPLIIIDALLAR